MWNIRKIVKKGDYLYAIVPEHPKKTKNNYVLLHRIIMENYLNRILNSNEIIHHINRNKKDNNIANLQLMTISEHAVHHAHEKGEKSVELKCPFCEKIFIRPRNKTHLIRKKYKATFCSRTCSGKFFTAIQYNGIDENKEKLLKENIVKEFIYYKY